MGLPVTQPAKRLTEALCVADPVSRLAPTSLPSFAECRPRGVWQAVRQPPLLPSSAAARLGTIVHRLLEEAGGGSFSPVTDPDVIERRWCELVANAEQAMATNPLERRSVPLEANVKKFEVLRLRAVARALELAQNITDPSGPAGDAAVTPYGYELRVASADGLIAGRIDRVIPAPGGPVLQDYKSGAIFSHRPDGETELKPAYTFQLRLYAVLYYEATGTWPSKLQLVPLTGEPHDVSFSPADSLRLLEDSRSLLAQVNDDIARGREDWVAAERLLASPSPSACRFCAYRPACLPYMARDLHDTDREWPADVWGEPAGLTQLGNGRLMLSIALPDGSLFFVRNVTEDVAEPAMLEPHHEGQLVGVFNARRTASLQAFEQGQITAIHVAAGTQE